MPTTEELQEILKNIRAAESEDRDEEYKELAKLLDQGLKFRVKIGELFSIEKDNFQDPAFKQALEGTTKTIEPAVIIESAREESSMPEQDMKATGKSMVDTLQGKGAPIKTSQEQALEEKTEPQQPSISPSSTITPAAQQASATTPSIIPIIEQSDSIYSSFSASSLRSAVAVDGERINPSKKPDHYATIQRISEKELVSIFKGEKPKTQKGNKTQIQRVERNLQISSIFYIALLEKVEHDEAHIITYKDQYKTRFGEAVNTEAALRIIEQEDISTIQRNLNAEDLLRKVSDELKNSYFPDIPPSKKRKMVVVSESDSDIEFPQKKRTKLSLSLSLPKFKSLKRKITIEPNSQQQEEVMIRNPLAFQKFLAEEMKITDKSLIQNQHILELAEIGMKWQQAQQAIRQEKLPDGFIPHSLAEQHLVLPEFQQFQTLVDAERELQRNFTTKKQALVQDQALEPYKQNIESFYTQQEERSKKRYERIARDAERHSDQSYNMEDLFGTTPQTLSTSVIISQTTLQHPPELDTTTQIKKVMDSKLPGYSQDPYQKITDALSAHDVEIKNPNLGADVTYQKIHEAIEEHHEKQALTSQIKTSSGIEIFIPHSNNSPILNPEGMTYTGTGGLKGFTIIKQAQNKDGQDVEGMAIVASYEALPDGKVKCSKIALPVGKDFSVQLIGKDGKDLLTQELRKSGKTEQVLIEEYLQANGAEGLKITAKHNDGRIFNLCSAEEFAKAKGIEKQVEIGIKRRVQFNDDIVNIPALEPLKQQSQSPALPLSDQSPHSQDIVVTNIQSQQEPQLGLSAAQLTDFIRFARLQDFNIEELRFERTPDGWFVLPTKLDGQEILEKFAQKRGLKLEYPQQKQPNTPLQLTNGEEKDSNKQKRVQFDDNIVEIHKLEPIKQQPQSPIHSLLEQSPHFKKMQAQRDDDDDDDDDGDFYQQSYNPSKTDPDEAKRQQIELNRTTAMTAANAAMLENANKHSKSLLDETPEKYVKQIIIEYKDYLTDPEWGDDSKTKLEESLKTQNIKVNIGGESYELDSTLFSEKTRVEKFNNALKAAEETDVKINAIELSQQSQNLEAKKPLTHKTTLEEIVSQLQNALGNDFEQLEKVQVKADAQKKTSISLGDIDIPQAVRKALLEKVNTGALSSTTPTIIHIANGTTPKTYKKTEFTK